MSGPQKIVLGAPFRVGRLAGFVELRIGILEYEAKVEAGVLSFNEQVFRSVFGEEVAFRFDYDSVGKDEVRGIVAVGRCVAYFSRLVFGFYSGLFKLFLYLFFKAGAIGSRFVAEGGAGIY